LCGLAVSFPAFAAVQTCSATAKACSLSTASPPIPSAAAHLAAVQNTFFAPGRATIKRLSNGQSHIIREFHAAMGLAGFAVQVGGLQGHDVLMYTSPNGRYFFLGGLFNARGQNLSRQYAHRYLPAAVSAPVAITPVAMQASLRKTTWFTVGKPDAPKHLWIVLDPNCIFCNLTFRHLLPAIQKGQLLLRVVPVGFLKPSSLPKAATILLAKDPAHALMTNELHFNQAMEEGGTTPASHIPTSVKAEATANTAWMSRNHLGGTPFLLWHGPHGTVHDQDGMPSGTTQFIQGIGHAS
jgi:thiol:disulfide interchange protein DsbG